MSFVIRKFHNEQTLGEKLHTLRMEARLTLSELAHKTKIQKSYLKAFEANAFHDLPDPIYARNYLQILVRTLGADENYYLDLFKQARGTSDVIKNIHAPVQRTRATKFFVTSRFAHVGLFIFFVAILASYIGVQIKTIISPPALAIVSPADGFSTTDATIIVKGKTDKGTRVQINGSDVLLSQDGSFQKEVALERGLNVLQIEGAKRYSHLATEYRRVIFDNSHVVGMK